MLSEAQEINQFREPTRPASISLLCAALLIFSLFQLLKPIQVASSWSVLSSLDLSYPPLIQAGEGLVWASAGLILARGCWKAKAWAPAAVLSTCLLFALIFWIKQIWIYEPAILQHSWLANLFYTLSGIGILAGILNLNATRSYFGRNQVNQEVRSRASI